jgi:hypothetical protein
LHEQLFNDIRSEMVQDIEIISVVGSGSPRGAYGNGNPTTVQTTTSYAVEESNIGCRCDTLTFVVEATHLVRDGTPKDRLTEYSAFRIENLDAGERRDRYMQDAERVESGVFIRLGRTCTSD